MQAQQSINSIITNELNFASDLGHAVERGNRADFALLLSMLSRDVRDIEPVEPFDTATESEEQLRIRLGVTKAQPLLSDENSYTHGAEIARHFHSGGMQSARLQSELTPDALAYRPHNTMGFDEEVYRNLSGHELNQLQQPARNPASTHNLYQKLVVAQRSDQLQAQV